MGGIGIDSIHHHRQYTPSHLIPEAVGKHSVCHGCGIRFLLEADALIPPSKPMRQRIVHPLGSIKLRLWNHIVLKHQRLLHHKQLLLALSCTVGAMRRLPP